MRICPAYTDNEIKYMARLNFVLNPYAIADVFIPFKCRFVFLSVRNSFEFRTLHCYLTTSSRSFLVCASAEVLTEAVLGTSSKLFKFGN